MTKISLSIALVLALFAGSPTKSWTQWQPKATYAYSQLPDQYMGANRIESGEGGVPGGEPQTGYNTCARNTWNQDSKCQTAWINSLEDFCLWGPAEYGTVGEKERSGVAYCTTDRHGTRLIPDGTIEGAHFVRTRDYVQVTGVGDFTSILIPDGDDGGEFDPHGADDLGNPIGGIVYTTANPATNGEPYFVSEWTNFMSYNQFCLRACWGERAAAQCEHIYDVMGCRWNIPANYEPGVFETCDGDVGLLQGIYGSSTFRQGDPVTPSAHPAPSSSQCSTVRTISHGLLAASANETSTSVASSSTTSAGVTSTTSRVASVATSPSSAGTNGSSNSGSSGSNANSNQNTATSSASTLTISAALAGLFAVGAAVVAL
ncbi:hypothetical protein NDA14_004859 [Ustilago hordei]|nr:hypothetical protein NDA14_004859 [Ustilago hordei]